MIGYNAGIFLYEKAIAFAGLWNEKARLWASGRKGLMTRICSEVKPDDRIIWVHAASLGEFEQGRPVIEYLKENYPSYKIVLTFYSPSGYESRKNYDGADYIYYLPSDRPSIARAFVKAVHPEIAIIVKYEFWLNVLAALRAHGTRTFLISSIFRENSVFFKWYGGAWRKALKGFETIFVQNEESVGLLKKLGLDNAVVAGDTRFDRVVALASTAKDIDAVTQFKGSSKMFIAGSTWGPDEEILLRLINDNPQIKFVVAPHEMDEGRISKFMTQTAGGAVRYTQITASTDLAGAHLLIIDTIGILKTVYKNAEWAYIGGGFGVGIHNTLEAATYGLPIAFGPKYQKFKEACDMISLGVAHSVSSYEELACWFAPLRDDESLREECGKRAKQFTLDNCGVTEKIIAKIFDK